MSQDMNANLALFIDFDNVALGARDARKRFDVNTLLQRVLEKGKIIVKRAYADWHYHKEYMTPLHEAAIELIEIPMPRISGKNSADIRLVVDAMDLCYSKEHIDTFVIVSGDSDFSPLVSKLRENNKRVIGIGVKNSSSKLLIGNCDEFIFYDDIYRGSVSRISNSVSQVPEDKREVFDFLVGTAQGLLQESRGVLYSSLIKDTMTRKRPDFNERVYGYSNFGDLLEDARRLGLLVVERDARAGGTWVVHSLGKGVALNGDRKEAAEGSSRSRRRRGRGRGRGRDAETKAKEAAATETGAKEVSGQTATPGQNAGDRAAGTEKKPDTKKAPVKKMTKKTTTKKKTAPGKKATKKAPAKKTTTRKKTAKKAPARKTTRKKTAKKTAKKAPAGKNQPEKAMGPAGDAD